MCKSLTKAVETCKEITRWRVSPYRCLYHNPGKYSLVEFARWTQKYLNYKIYKTLLEAAKITGYEPVPAELLSGHASRYNFSGKKIKVGRILFYLIKPDEMTSKLKIRYGEFKELILKGINGEVE